MTDAERAQQKKDADEQQLETARHVLEQAHDNTDARFRASFEAVGFAPLVMAFLEATVSVRRADRQLQAIAQAHPNMRGLCLAMAAELTERLAPQAPTSELMH